MDFDTIIQTANSIWAFLKYRPESGYSLLIGLPIIIFAAIYFSIKKKALFAEAGLDPNVKAESFKFTPKTLDDSEK
jgi:hypothetical protein